MRLVLESVTFDPEEIALKWLDHVDGKSIFPKLPVYLRTFREKYLRNRRVEDAAKKMNQEGAYLKQLNSQLKPAQ